MELIALQDIQTEGFKNDYEKIKSLAPKLHHRGVKIYITRDDYIKHTDDLTKKLETKYGGKKPYFTQMLLDIGLNPKIFNYRIRNGWSYEDALTTPKGERNPAHNRKKRLQQFTGGIAGGGKGSIMRGADKLVLAKALNKLSDIAEFMGAKVDSEVEVFNNEENKTFFTRNERVSKKKG